MEKKLTKYLCAVRRRLNMPNDAKDRVMADFESSVRCRLEEGQTLDKIVRELGKPGKAAADLNGQMQEFTYQKSPWRWGCLGLALFSGLCLAHKGLPGLLLVLFNKANNASIGIIGGADGPTAVFVTTNPNGQVFPSVGIYILLLVMGIIGFLALCRIEPKKD